MKTDELKPTPVIAVHSHRHGYDVKILDHDATPEEHFDFEPDRGEDIETFPVTDLPEPYSRAVELQDENTKLRAALAAIIQQPIGHTAADAGKDLGACCRIARAALGDQ